MREVDIGGGVRVACSITGSGPPILLLHGAEGSHRMFEAIEPHLASHFTVVAYDQRDCGATMNPGGPVGVVDLADDASALLRTLDVRSAHVYGHSFGGRVAQALAHRHPKVVASLVLGNTWALPQTLEELNPDGVKQIVALRDRLPETADELAPYFLPEAFLAERPELRNIFRQSPPRSDRSARRAATVANRPALDPRAITARTLCITGSLDRVVPARATAALAGQVPAAELITLDGVGHAGVLQVPDVIAGHVWHFCLASPAFGPRSPAPFTSTTATRSTA